jgi:DnaJ-class molecular chaperone
MDYTQPQFIPTLMKLSQDIDQMDYFQILNLKQSCNKMDIKNNYYNMSRALHPDKFFHLENKELQAAVKKIYRRITESYTMLRNEKKRSLYVVQINGSERATHLRFKESDDQKLMEQDREKKEIVKTAQGKKLYAAYLSEMSRKNWDAAHRHLQSAMIFEMGNVRLAELQKALNEKRSAAQKGVPES